MRPNIGIRGATSERSSNLTLGEDGQTDLHANYGARVGQFGFLLETVQRSYDGFKDISGSSQDTGFDIEDYVLKLAWEGERQSLWFKDQYSEETSDETYLGLTDADFDDDENRRYGLSSIDEMDNDHQGYNLTYRLSLNDQVSMTAIAYYNEFSRDWFKLSSGNSYITAANGGDAFSQGVLDGTQDVEGLKYKHNSRDYEFQGIDVNFDFASGAHTLALSGRVHEDEMDRFQPTELYDQVSGELVFAGVIEPLCSNDRLERA